MKEEKKKVFDKRLLKKSVFLIPFFTVLIGGAILFWAGKFVFGKYTSLRGEITSLGSENGVLQERVDSLSAIDKSSFIKNVNQSTFVLPPFDPTLQMLSQLRAKAAEKNLSFEKLSLGGSGDYEGLPGVKLVGVSFSVKGDYKDILGYLSDISFVSPLIKIVDVKIRESLADVTVESYWSSYPDTLPSVTSPVVTLSAEDKSLLSSLNKFQQSEFQTPQQAASVPVQEGRVSPFALP